MGGKSRARCRNGSVLGFHSSGDYVLALSNAGGKKILLAYSGILMGHLHWVFLRGSVKTKDGKAVRLQAGLSHHFSDAQGRVHLPQDCLFGDPTAPGVHA